MKFTQAIMVILLLAGAQASLCQQISRKADLMFEQAESAYSDGKYKEAIALLDGCLKEFPGYMEAYALRGSLRELTNDSDGALTDYSVYLDKFPAHTEVLMNRAVIRYKIGFLDQAFEDFRQLLLLPPSHETNSLFFKKNMAVGDSNPIVTTTQGGNHRSFIYNYLGLTELKRKHVRDAKIFFDSAILLNSSEPDYFVNRGLAKEASHDSTASLDYLHALRINGNHTLAKHNLKAAQHKQAESMSKEERLSQTIAADSTMLYPYLERAQQRFESQYYQGAVDDYTRALEIDSSNVEVWLGRGLAKEKLKDYKGAFSDYTNAIDRKENFAKGWLNRGNVLLKLERFDDAIDDYNVALIYYNDYSVAYYNRAMAKAKLKKYDTACEDIKKAEELGMKVDAKIKGRVCGDSH